MSSKLIPAQEKGKSVDLVESVTTTEVEEAKQLFQNAVYLVRRPTLWHETAGTLSATFTIDGKQAEQPIEDGDYIRISIPGPGLKEGEGEDWVKVSTIKTDLADQFDESFGFKVEVCPNPHTSGDAIAHFFAEGASSTFLVTRKDKTVSAHYKGRNETANTEDLALVDKVRNIIVAAGALAGVSELQWTAFLKGLIKFQGK